MNSDDSKKIALFGDIHSNKYALESILAEISKHNYQATYCLGDLIGCGPNSNECLHLAQLHNVRYLLGNHDVVVLSGKKADHCDESDRDEYFEIVRGELDEEAFAYLKTAKVSEILNLPGGRVKLEHFLSYTDRTDIYPYHSRKVLADGRAEQIIAESDCNLTINAHLHSRVPDIFTNGKALRFLCSSGCVGHAKTFYYTLDIETLKLERVFVDYDSGAFAQEYAKLKAKAYKNKLDGLDYFELQSTAQGRTAHKLWQIFDEMSDIEYGFVDKNGERHEDSLEGFSELYRLQSAEQVRQNKLGVCWDQVELERAEFEKNNLGFHSLFIVYYNDDRCPTHTFMLCESSRYVYWFEHSWNTYKGIFRFDSIEQALKSIRSKFVHFELEDHPYNPMNLCIFEYGKPQSGLSCLEFYKHCEAGKNINKLD